MENTQRNTFLSTKFEQRIFLKGGVGKRMIITRVLLAYLRNFEENMKGRKLKQGKRTLKLRT